MYKTLSKLQVPIRIFTENNIFTISFHNQSYKNTIFTILPSMRCFRYSIIGGDWFLFSLLTCYSFRSWVSLRSSLGQPLKECWFNDGPALQVLSRSFFVVIETLWVLCNCLVTHSALCASWRPAPHFRLFGRLCGAVSLASSCKFLLSGTGGRSGRGGAHRPKKVLAKKW